ncbi:MAG: hypothetical protein CSA36_01225 [Draconibacterium sp.]|nr:MAG: hypothetical protein CSA36_01225 [Draconibacterium sp.]
MKFMMYIKENTTLSEIYAFALFVILLLNGCTHKKDWTSEIHNVKDYINSFPLQQELKSTIFIDDTLNLKNPMDIKIIANFMILKDMHPSGYILSVFDMQTKKYFGDFLKKGKGPEEYIGCSINNYDKDTLIVFDSYRKEAALFSTKSIDNLLNTPDRKIIFSLSENDGDIINIYHLNNSIIASGAFVDGRFCVFSENGKKKYGFGTYPSVNYKEPLDLYQLGGLFGSAISFCSNRNKLAVIGTHWFDIYKHKEDNFSDQTSFSLEWNSPAIALADYRDDKPFVAKNMHKSYRSAGTSVCVGDYIIFTFSGINIFDMAKSGVTDTYRYIMVTDWEGTPCMCYSLDKNIGSSLAKDPNEKFLYAIHTDMKTGYKQILKFDINEILGFVEQN